MRKYNCNERKNGNQKTQTKIYKQTMNKMRKIKFVIKDDEKRTKKYNQILSFNLVKEK